MRLIDGIVERASDSLIVSALAEPTAMQTVAVAMTQTVYEEQILDDDDRVIAAAIADGARYKEQLLGRAGGAYSADQLGTMLGRTRQAINEGRTRNLYFGVPVDQTTFAYPKCQLWENGLLSGLRAFLDAFDTQDPWTQLMVLVEPTERLKRRSPLDALRRGDLAGAERVAATYGHHGA